MRDEIVTFLDQLLEAGSIPDYGPQGLVVEGKADVKKVACGVTASVELFRRAVEAKADLVVVHHGLFWDFHPRVVRGGLKEKLRLLLDHDVSLLCYHLVLDAHEEHGNNALIARALGLTDVERFGDYSGVKIGWKGRFPEPVAHAELEARMTAVFGRAPLIFPFGPDPVRTIGVISGGAVNDLQQAIDEGLDAYLTGEVKEFVQENAREEGITYVSAGHYHTETFGVRSLGERLHRELGVEHVFLDVPNPV